jgi:hypothetical protein
VKWPTRAKPEPTALTAAKRQDRGQRETTAIPYCQNSAPKDSQDDKTTGGCIFNLATGPVSCFRNQEIKEQPAFDLKTTRGSEKVSISRLTQSSFTRQALTSSPFERAFESSPSY